MLLIPLAGFAVTFGVGVSVTLSNVVAIISTCINGEMCKGNQCYDTSYFNFHIRGF